MLYVQGNLLVLTEFFVDGIQSNGVFTLTVTETEVDGIGLCNSVWNSTHYRDRDRCRRVLYPISLSGSRFCRCDLYHYLDES